MGKSLVLIDQANHGSTVKNLKWSSNFIALENPYGSLEVWCLDPTPDTQIKWFGMWPGHQEKQQNLGTSAGGYKLHEDKNYVHHIYHNFLSA